MRIRDESKEQSIREKALKMFVKEGFDGFSMQKLAKAADVSPATIYIYFKDKEDLIFQLCEAEGTKMVEEMMKDFYPSMSFNDGLRLQWINRARYCMENLDQMYFLEQIRHSPFNEKLYNMGSESYRSAMHSFKMAMIEFTNNAISNKELVEVPLEVFWTIAFGPLYTLVRFYATGTSVGGTKFTYTNEIMEQTLQLVLKALKP